MTTIQAGQVKYVGESAVDFGEMRTRGNCKHSGFGEYDNLTGYLTKSYVSEWQDKDGTRWRTTVEVVNLGRPDRGVAVDPDVLLDAEAWKESPPAREDPVMARERARALAAEKQDEGRLLILDYLETHGLNTIRKLAKALGMERSWLRDQLVNGEGIYYQRIRTTHGDEWGITGVTYAPEDALSGYVKKVRACLLEQGPMTVREFCALAGINKGSATGRMAKMTDIFCVVGHKQVPRPDGSCYPVAMWGVVGVHDKGQGNGERRV